MLSERFLLKWTRKYIEPKDVALTAESRATSPAFAQIKNLELPQRWVTPREQRIKDRQFHNRQILWCQMNRSRWKTKKIRSQRWPSWQWGLMPNSRTS